MTDTAKKEATTEKETIGYAWNFAADLGNGCQFSLSGNFPKGLSGADMSKEVDKVRRVFDRQQAKSASLGVEQEIDQLILRRDSAAEDLAMIDTKSEAKGGLSSAERQQREAAVVHLAKMDKDIAFKKEVLAKLKDEAK